MLTKRDVSTILRWAEENHKLWLEQNDDCNCTCGADDGNGGSSGCILHYGLEVSEKLLKRLQEQLPSTISKLEVAE